MKRRIHAFVTPLGLIAALALAAPALAGPPLLCHPFEIGAARSLPWNASGGWADGRRDYAIANLVGDTDALLTPSTPVLVRMETLRRAALYASHDSQVAKQLLGRLLARVDASEASGRPDALVLLDAAYVTEAFREISSLSENREFADRAAAVRAALGNADGRALINRSIAARPDDPAIQFAAALIFADNNRSRYVDHAAKARAGAARDPLLALNLTHVQ
jgi:hypothetical protein